MYAGACASARRLSRRVLISLPAGLLSFLESQTPLFLRELWGHLRSAEANALPGVPGIPQFLLDAKREEMAKRDAANTRMQSLLAGPRFGDAGSALPPPPPLPLPPPPPLPKPPLVLGDDRQRDRSPGRAPLWDDKRERSRSGDRRRGRHSRSRSRDRDRSRSRARRERRRGSDSDDSRERKHKRKHKHRSRKHRSRSRSAGEKGEHRREAELPDVLPPMPPPPVEPEAPPLPLALWQQKLAADGEEP